MLGSLHQVSGQLFGSSDIFFQTIVFDFDGVLVESIDIKAQAFVKLYK